MSGSVSVFMYHRVLPLKRPDAVSLATFRAQIDYIARHYEILDPAAFRDLRASPARLRKAYALLTFDDGWLDNWLYATPVLQKHRIRAVLALTTASVSPGKARTPETGADDCLPLDEACRASLRDADHRAYLRASELEAMLHSGCWDIQAHGHHHRRHYLRLDAACGRYPAQTSPYLDYALEGRPPAQGLPIGRMVSELAAPRHTVPDDLLASPPEKSPLPPAETQSEYEQRLEASLEQCWTTIERLGAPRPDMLFWPWGEYSRSGLALAQKLGFAHQFGVSKGAWHPAAAAPLTCVLPRIGASENMRKFVRNAFFCRSRWRERLYKAFSKHKPGPVDRL